LSVYLNYGPKLYAKNKNKIFLITSIIGVILLVFLFIKLFELKYSLISSAIYGKAIPVLILSLISFYIVKDKKPNFINWTGMILIIIGIIIMEMN
jgi:uncharacterized membrane protein